MKAELRPVGIPGRETFFQVLSQYVFHLDNTYIPFELRPLFGPEKKIDKVVLEENVPDEQEDYIFFNPDSFELKLEQYRERGYSTVTEEGTTSHFGMEYGKTTNLYLGEHGYPMARSIAYSHNSDDPKYNDIFNPEYTYELMGYNEDNGCLMSLSVTSYKKGREQQLIYTLFEQGIKTHIHVGRPKLSEKSLRVLSRLFSG